MRRKLVAGNWKMNGLRRDLAELDTLTALHPNPAVDLMLCLPAPLLAEAALRAAGHALLIGAQDCHHAASGAHTGDISADMIADTGASAVILGHSERREDHEESSEIVRKKARVAQKAGLTTVICLGESLDQRESLNTLDIIDGQLSASVPDGATGLNLIIAYEPIWAIGTGLIPSLDQIGEVHDFIRVRLERRFGLGVGQAVRILYGGSVKPDNCTEIFAVSNVDGALVGGASLKAEDLSPIIKSLEAEA
ncbi:MAG TPA: triose-phosphate isomerase [Rhodobacteraceae bacterium]|nr:triose-phosphate isomerase [Paracoccaceae bacterium]HBV54224.1 triose-phosphate isomerase [Paracoccaceae bacterium]